MGDPRTRAGRQLLARYPELVVAAVSEVEEQARGQGKADALERMDRVLDRLQPLLTDEQLGAVRAVRALDPDAIAELDDTTLRGVLGGLSDPRLTPTPDAETREAARRYLNEIM